MGCIPPAPVVTASRRATSLPTWPGGTRCSLLAVALRNDSSASQRPGWVGIPFLKELLQDSWRTVMPCGWPLRGDLQEGLVWHQLSKALTPQVAKPNLSPLPSSPLP